VTKTLRDINGDFVDDMQVRDGKVNEADVTKYIYLDNNSILVTNRNLHSQTVSGLPSILQSYDGDLTVVYHGLSMASSQICMMITSIDSATNTNSGFKMTIYNNSSEVIVTRESGNTIIARYTLPIYSTTLRWKNTYIFIFIYSERWFWEFIFTCFLGWYKCWIRTETTRTLRLGYFKWNLYWSFFLLSCQFNNI
jgi:hypothetical protein